MGEAGDSEMIVGAMFNETDIKPTGTDIEPTGF
jgi:hypothetical protein